MRRVLVFVVAGVCMISCAKIVSTTVFIESPSYDGPIEVRSDPSHRCAGDKLFEMTIKAFDDFDAQGRPRVGLPREDMMNEVKAEGRRLGADLLIFDCGAPGTVGQGSCVVTGCREREAGPQPD